MSAAAVAALLLLVLLAVVAAVATYRAFAWDRANKAEHRGLLTLGAGLDGALVSAQSATFAGSVSNGQLASMVTSAVTALQSSLAQLQALAGSADETHASFARLSLSLDPGLVRDAQKLQSDQSQLKDALAALSSAVASIAGPDSQLTAAQTTLQALQSRFDAADADLSAAYPEDLVAKVGDLLQLQVRVRDMADQMTAFLSSEYSHVLSIDQLLGSKATAADLDQAGAKMQAAYDQFDASIEAMLGVDVTTGRASFVSQVAQLSDQLQGAGDIGSRQAALAQLRLGDPQKVALDATSLCLGPSADASTCFGKADLQLLAAE